ncbi:MAG: sigma 54-interacting transcriptional regulator [Vicinamibacterales bacterium]
MDTVTRVRELFAEGQFAQCRQLLQSIPLVRTDTTTVLLKARVSELTGDLDGARQSAHHILRSRLTSDLQRSAAELVLSRVAGASGDPESELALLQKALVLAERAEDVQQIAWTQLRMLALRADRDGSQSCRALMASLRRNVGCAGDPALTAAVHLVVADADGKHGLLSKSAQHVRLAQSLLQRYPNVWLSGWAETTALALAILQGDMPGAMDHGTRALALGRQSGAAAVIRSALANLGRLHYSRGEFDRALELLHEALTTTPPDGELSLGIRDSIARVHMAQNRLDVSEALLASTTICDRQSARSGRYIHRHSLLTKAELLVRQGRHGEAAAFFDEASALAARCGDTVLEDAVRHLAEESCCLAGDLPRTVDIPVPRQLTPDASIRYERALAARLLASGDGAAALRHRDRALRLCASISNRQAEQEVWQKWTALTARRGEPHTDRPRTTGNGLQDLAAVLMHARRPELVATELLAALEGSGHAVAAHVILRGTDGSSSQMTGFGTIRAADEVRTFRVGASGTRTVELEVVPHPDLESRTTVSLLDFLVLTSHEIERARIAREETLTLWPTEELPAEDDDSVAAGRMREALLAVRKIADTDITVVITGESGTGKEVLARAIHRYSQRSARPFVPFNCTAVPRELLESHLFGYRRGAFTGADRDNPGLIRAAKDGTLFLDEIGDLALDLQPKLLRFLESSEVHPLGEAAPTRVNVRIIAATNANLRAMVDQGRFREDLYYRLHVFPIELPPLRERRDEIAPLAQFFALKWSHEMRKGHVRIADDLMEHLRLCDWPGNIRQLSNEISRMVATTDPDGELTLASLSPGMRGARHADIRPRSDAELPVRLDGDLPSAVAWLEREMIGRALARHDGRVDSAARALGISRKGLYLKRQRLGV